MANLFIVQTKPCAQGTGKRFIAACSVSFILARSWSHVFICDLLASAASVHRLDKIESDHAAKMVTDFSAEKCFDNQ